ncbi:UDP-N-acetylmuramoyl-tripeptide--D-alanyl-D-alanine ligase [Pseudaestuariivita atlantica]|uniref:UDP-N-acetylmuramoyl-tripeptide--D-alanyl-D-alanine ligase n=1 Tax=Pseudaestuariivita atlantica TaxID=1317121 RepID=A0A0L1JTX5_9RHOB|nr:UDP-N-acetylmuramoyl-tripeptide--D-alanyl-D-alanine ligase [Pseudaestuariivita atlantica]KNG95142.1 UDP-N-acetylmuramoyl-tripeptide--D-alanyl-D-alanine ligase [Pseudaestuariivita atlantica]
MTLWTAQDAAAATGGRATTDWAATGVSIDTRTLEPGDLFVALQAARDGHEFVAQALEKGAAAALVSRVPDGVAEDAPLLIVEDVLTALEDLGRAGRARTGARVVAVTGSVGKTSTKEMLRTVLERQGRTHASVKSYNNHWGVPLTLARMPADTDYAVIEIGMNHPGEIAPLSRLARPHVAMVTNVAPVHLEAFDDGLVGIAREKASIVEGIEDAADDKASVLCADVPEEAYKELDLTTPEIRRFWYGSEDDNPWHLRKVTLTDSATVVEATTPHGPVMFKLSVPGKHFAINALGVLAAVEALGADPVLAALDIARWTPPEGRGTRERRLLDPIDEATGFELIDDAYNANPTSMAAALEVLSVTRPRDGIGRVARGRRIAILGDMLELGPDEAAMHAGLADLPAMESLAQVHCVGPRMRALYDALPEAVRGRWAETAPDLAAKAHTLIDAGDVVLVKGSLGSKVSQVVDGLRKISHPVATDDEG